MRNRNTGAATHSGQAGQATRLPDAEPCRGPRCPDMGSVMCVLCGSWYCERHCPRVSLFTLFRARTDLPEEVVDLLNSIEDARARVRLCVRCESGAPISRSVEGE